MDIKWIGSVLIVAGCGGVGFSLAGGYRKERQLLQQLLALLTFLECQLRCALTPLPELCRQAGRSTGGVLEEVMLNFSRELDWQRSPDPGSSMEAALKRSHSLPAGLRQLLRQLGTTFGKFDLAGQLQEFDRLRSLCARELQQLESRLEPRVKTCNALSLCAGVAAAILLV